MTYEEALQKINSRLRFGIKPGLERIEALCKKLGDPQKKPRFVHVAGTNGKGTTCTLIASVLTAAGYRTGLYTSPYVLDFRERFRIDGEMIPEAELIEEVKRVSPIADELEAKGETITEFEFITALAFDWFAQRDCDFVVLEVGLGGRFDATNVIDTPEAAAISPRYRRTTTPSCSLLQPRSSLREDRVRESGHHQKGRRRRAVPRAGSVRVRDHRIGVQRARRTPAYSG